LDEIYDIVDNIIDKIVDVLEDSKLEIKKVLVGPLTKSKLKNLPILWVIPDNLVFEEDQMHMDLYRYNVNILSLNKPSKILKDPMSGPKLVTEAFKTIRDGLRTDTSTRAYIQHIRLMRVDYIGDNITEKNLFITSGQISFLIRSKP